MENLDESVHVVVDDGTTTKCLICDHNVVKEDSLVIKQEMEESCKQTDLNREYYYGDEGYVPRPPVKLETEQPATGAKGHLNFLNTFCKLLRLTSQNKAKLRRSKLGQSNSVFFCANCCLIISDAVKLFEQIQVLQNNVQKIGDRVGSILTQSYLNHVNDNGHENGNCKGKSCSQLDKWRESIINDVQARSSKEQLIATKSPSPDKNGFKDISNKCSEKPQLKGLSVTLHRLTNDEIEIAKYCNKRPKDEIPVSLGCEFDTNEIDDGPQHVDADSDCLPNSPASPMLAESDKSDADDDPPRKKLLLKKGKQNEAAGPSTTRKIDKVECAECHQSFRNEHLMNLHLAKFHEIDIKAKFPFNCVCGKIFPIKSQLELHLKRQKGTCKETKLPEHCKIVTGLGHKKFQCTICGYRERRKCRIVTHLQVHTKVKNHMCDVCGISLTAKRTLQQHKLLKHFDGNIEDHPFKCKFPNCDKYFSNRAALKNHEKLFHGVGEFNFPCLQCDFKGVSKGQLNRHHKFKHTDFRPYKCEICNKAYKQSEVLKRHNLQYHTAPEDRPYKCTVCGKGFASRYRLSNHEAVHTNSNPVLCGICGKSFAIKVYLGIHMKIHEKKGEIPSQKLEIIVPSAN